MFISMSQVHAFYQAPKPGTHCTISGVLAAIRAWSFLTCTNGKENLFDI